MRYRSICEQYGRLSSVAGLGLPTLAHAGITHAFNLKTTGDDYFFVFIGAAAGVFGAIAAEVFADGILKIQKAVEDEGTVIKQQAQAITYSACLSISIALNMMGFTLDDFEHKKNPVKTAPAISVSGQKIPDASFE